MDQSSMVRVNITIVFVCGEVWRILPYIAPRLLTCADTICSSSRIP